MSNIVQSNPPFDYQDINLYNSQRSPSTIHSRNTSLRFYFFKYLFNEVLSVYKWKIPKHWDLDFFRFTLFGGGYVVIFDTEKFGVVPYWGSLGGYNFFRLPSYAIITNEHLPKTLQLDIGKDCEIIKMQPDYTPILDIVGYYADLMSVTAESMGMNILNTQSATIFGASNTAESESYKKMFDKVASGEPMVVVRKKLLDPDGKPTWFPFTQNIKESYIASDLLVDIAKIKNQFDTIIGIPNANTEKKERMLTDEINANNTETMALSELWLETMQDGINKANEMFNLNISVTRRFKENVPENTNERNDKNV